MQVNWQYLTIAPGLPGLYVRAARRRKITGTQLPAEGLCCWVTVDTKRLAAYRKVCGFADTGLMPATYPHVLAFPLQMQLLTAKDFPFPLMGLVHLSNRIRILRPLGGVTSLRVGVQVQNLQPHAKGATFDLLTQVDDALGPLWEAESRMLCRGVELAGDAPEEVDRQPGELAELTRWQCPADIGRQYARVSGDYNPIHLSALSARLFGFPQAIAHGLWNKARTLAALGNHLPAANIEIDVTFRKPVRLPNEVLLYASAPGSSGELRLTGAGELEHMTGNWHPIG
ncbi:acyl dehydratase [Pseudomonas gingeri]|uniref:MaoC family dehydratase n=1 Tax=Pseudomonas TaxID=286 RepID=UPI0015A0C896|nr:MaoC/PaaZ C-terminal domain-containing protein [Pseudomonas gingeri]NVZ24898.1 acyl dehydratase [Pseudomonas gingeri]NWA06430.1 acyl dehydratase [Pseudomonas gingeri]NWE49741.1 acyl dehydratase [Pseudomonas gingeri]